MTKHIFLSMLLLGLLAVGVDSSAQTLMVHGSGTTNPENCFASIIEKFTARAKQPIRMTYRSIGSSAGLTEFINNFESPIVDFASGEIPLPTEDYQKFKDNNITVLHLPALFGAVSFFHSVPGVPNMNLTSCILSRIFTRDIKDWSHPDIMKLNPNMDLRRFATLDGEGLKIRVARRESGSGNTLAITEYLHKSCPESFPDYMVGSLPTWPADTVACRGNGGLLGCIQNEAGTIGYLEAGSGVDAGLPEISIKNKYGRTLNSKQAKAYNGIGAKENGVLPEDPSADFGDVSLLDQNGEFTWPITLLTYIYVRLDLEHMEDLHERSLLVAFLKALYDPEFAEVCADRYGFTLAEGVSYDLAQKAINMLETKMGLDNSWLFEYKARPLIGTGEYVISTTRNSLPQDERDYNRETVRELLATVEKLEKEVVNLRKAQADGLAYGNADEVEYTESEEAKVMAGLVLACIGVVLSCLAIGVAFAKADGKM